VSDPVGAVPRIGPFLVELERLEQAQRPGVFLVDRVQAIPGGVLVQILSGEHIALNSTASTRTIAAALHAKVHDLQVPADDAEFPIPTEPDVQKQWAVLHYALGAFESLLLEHAQVHVLAVERDGTRATVQVARGPHGTVESYSLDLDLDREIDFGLADTIAFAPSYGLVNGSLNQN
jgi:hypothetical protein